MNYHIEELSNTNESDWIRLSEESKEGSFFHTLKWKRIMEQSSDRRSHYFLLYRNNEPVALCPFYESVINGISGLISLPDSDYNHILITDKEDPLIPLNILDKCKEIAGKNKLFFILIATNEKTKDHFNKYKPLPYPLSGNMVLNLENLSCDKMWKDVLSRKTRKHIRRLEIDGFRIRETNSIDDIKTFYEYYNKNIKYLNSTPYTFSHFEDLISTYSRKEMTVTMLYQNEIVAGGLLCFFHNPSRTIYLRYLSLNRNIAPVYSPTYLLFWDMIKRAIEMGYHRLCFGRTLPYQNQVNYKLKEKFGGQYEKEYSFLFPRSYFFKIGYIIYYDIYTLMKKRKFGSLVS